MWWMPFVWLVSVVVVGVLLVILIVVVCVMFSVFVCSSSGGSCGMGSGEDSGD